MDEYEHKYKKYKNKYLLLKQQQTGGNDLVNKHLKLYEILNFEGANKKNFDIIRAIYHENALVRMGNEPGTTNFSKTEEEMKQMYQMAPNTTITRHDVQFGSGEWTVIEQVMTGTFTGKYTLNGAQCDPNQNTFQMRACSLVRWENNRIAEENIFWDNHSFIKQLGIADHKCLGKLDQIKYSLVDKIGFISYGRGDETDEKVRRHIILFENFNFNGYNKRNWTMANDIYDKDAVVIFQSGKQLNGIDQIMKQMASGIQDDKIVSIPIHFGSGDWTVATMLMTGTLMDGKSWTMEHCALMKWRNDKIIEAHAYWDNAEFQKQTGIVLDL